MESNIDTSTSIIGVDCSGTERRAFLKKLQRQSRFCKCSGPVVIPEYMIGCDVSKLDSRSVKAYLDGRWSWRVIWWNINTCIHKAICRWRASSSMIGKTTTVVAGALTQHNCYPSALVASSNMLPVQ